MDNSFDEHSQDNLDLSEFSSTYLVDEKAVTSKKNYVLKICDSSSNKIGIVISNSTCEVYSYITSSLVKVNKLAENSIKVTEAKFSPLNENVIYLSSQDGTIRLWDLRTSDKCSVVYKENEESKKFNKPLVACDVSYNDRVLCGGTESIQGDTFMLFWDVRKTDLLGAYWNSHTGNIVQVQFSKTKADELITAGEDGLINIFDVTELTEDDALQFSLNTECPVDKMCRLSDDRIACITDNVDVQIWNTKTADQISTFSREKISNAMKKYEEDCYVIDVFNSSSNIPTILTGTYPYSEGRCLRSLEMSKKKLKPQSNYNGNKQIIRCSLYDNRNDLLITGGESGMLSLWKSGDPSTSSPLIASDHKNKPLAGVEKFKTHRSKPY